MANLITPLDQIKVELEEIQNYTEITCSEDMNEVAERGNDLAVYISRTGKLLADAKYHKDKKLNNDVVQNIKTILSLSASSANKYIDTLCVEENYIVNWCERLNRACTHQLEWSRTLISKAKEELRLSGYSQNVRHN